MISMAELSIIELKELLIDMECDYVEYEEEEDGWDSSYHSWECRRCELETIYNNKRADSESVLPGKLPILSGVPYIIKNVSIEELELGDFARYLSMPGISDYPFEYAECLSIDHEEGMDDYRVTWKKTNSGDSPFTVVYSTGTNLNIIRKLP